MDPHRAAIDAALARNWKQAITLNQQIIKQNPKDIEALNRLGRAYLETGQKTKAATIYGKVLRLDKFNSIATKSLGLLKTMRVNRHSSPALSSSAPMFLEEPGVTKTVALTRLGDSKIVARLHAGDPVILAAREHCVVATTSANEYLGRLPDDLASRLRVFLKNGNRYEAWIRTIDLASTTNSQPALKIFIREVVRSPKFKTIPSFPSTEKLNYAAFAPPDLVHQDKPIVTTTEEDSSEDFSGSDTGDDSSDTEPLSDDD